MEQDAKAPYLNTLIPYMKKSGYYIRPDGKIDKYLRQQDWDEPWVHINRRQGEKCGIYHRITFGVFGVVPKFCQECCVKVAIYPIDLKELEEVYQILKDRPYHSKCGIDERCCGRLFGAYVYTDTWAKGANIFNELKPALKGIDSTIKRGCTEFGPQDDWEYSLEDEQIERFVNDWICVDNNAYYQPPYLIDRIRYRWKVHAKKYNAEG